MERILEGAVDRGEFASHGLNLFKRMLVSTGRVLVEFVNVGSALLT